MSQPLRPNPSGWFHVMNRGARRRDIFLDDDDRELFLRLVIGIRKRFDVRTVSYCLMGNHYHLLLHCPDPSLSQAMQWLGATYVRKFNAKHGFDGPLWKSRYTDVPIRDDIQLVTLTRYIHRNPLAISMKAELGSYRWSSHGAYIGARQEPWWLDTAAPLAQFSNDRAAFQRTVETALPSDTIKNRSSNVVPLVADETTGPTGERKILEIQRAVADASDTTLEAVRAREPGKYNPLRDAAIVLGADELMIGIERLTEAFGYVSENSVRSALTRARKRGMSDPKFAALVQRARIELEANEAA